MKKAPCIHYHKKWIDYYRALMIFVKILSRIILWLIDCHAICTSTNMAYLCEMHTTAHMNIHTPLFGGKKCHTKNTLAKRRDVIVRESKTRTLNTTPNSIPG